MTLPGQTPEPVPPPPNEPAGDALGDALATLRSRLGALRLELATPGQPEASADRRAAIGQLDDYLLPRLASMDAPMLVVVGGSTGAGKSTLVNSILGEHVSAPGVLRPTTRAPVLVHNPLDARWFTTDRILPGLARLTATDALDAARGLDATSERQQPTSTLRLVPSETVPVGIALLDAPDVDSVETANRELAAKLLAAADLWLFVTTAARYADAVPWDLLTAASARRAQVALVLDRVDPGAHAVAADLKRMAAEHGLEDSPIFVIDEAVGDLTQGSGLLPEAAVAEVSTWLSNLGGDPAARARVIAATADGVVDDLVRRSVSLAVAADAQEEADHRLRDAVDLYFGQAARNAAEASTQGSILRGEVLARWQDFVGTSEFFRSIEKGVGKARDAVVRAFRGKPAGAPQVEQALATGLESVILDAAETAVEQTFNAWRCDAAGAALLGGLELSRTSASLRAEIEQQVRDWQSDILELVRQQGAAKRGTARALSLGVNALGVALMVVVFASTAGITGAEIGIAGGTAVVGQKLLEAVFGDDAVRKLASQAEAKLAARIEYILSGQAARFTSQLDALGTSNAGGESLRAAARVVESTSRMERDARVIERTTARHRVTGMLRGAGLLPKPRTSLTADGRADGQAPTEADPGQEAPPQKRGFWRRLVGQGRGRGR